jgi:hypothetical protein
MNALRTWPIRFCPPDHLLREVFETCRDFGAARRRLETVPVARPVIFHAHRVRPRRALRDRAHRRKLCHARP